MGHHAHVETSHDEDRVAAKSEDGCADSWAAIATVTIVVVTMLFWLTGMPA